MGSLFRKEQFASAAGQFQSNQDGASTAIRILARAPCLTGQSMVTFLRTATIGSPGDDRELIVQLNPIGDELRIT